MKEKRKRMRLPNGFGQISEIKGRRLRKPFRAMVTVGKTETGKPICKLLKPEAYFRTYNEAYEALILYHRSPTDLSKNYTMDEVFNMWLEEYKKKEIVDKTINRIPTLWRYVSVLHSKKISLVKTPDLKAAIDSADTDSPNVLKKLKSLLNQMYDYAVMMEIVDKNYARQLKINIKKEEVENPHLIYTDEEMEILWNNKDDELVKSILIQCYMGWRPNELLEIKLSDIDELEMTIIGGSKTDAGRDRIVPVANKIRPLVEYFIRNSKESTYSGKLFYQWSSYFTYYKKYKRVLASLGLNENHRPHDARKTFITRAKKKGLDEFAIKRLVGHTISDITERVYTERDVEWLRAEVNKL